MLFSVFGALVTAPLCCPYEVIPQFYSSGQSFDAVRISDKLDQMVFGGAAATLTNDSTKDLLRAHQGGKLSRKQATLLEQKVDADTNDVNSRVSLLGYYHRTSVLSWSGFLWSVLRRNSIHQRRYMDLITWFVENRSHSHESGLPEMYPPLGFDESDSKTLKELWEKQVEKSPTNLTVLCNAASFFHHIDKVVSEKLLRSAQELDPDSAYIAGRLSQLYMLMAKQRPEQLTEALSQKESQIEKNSRFNPHDLQNLAALAFATNDYEKAELVATRLVAIATEHHDGRSDYGDGIHDGNSILGRIAVRRGDISAAKTFLWKASQSLGSPSLNSFGPDMDLAQDLLEIGERKSVIDYLWACHRFWNGLFGTIPTLLWILFIRAGCKPVLNRVRSLSESTTVS
jgi:tetratricopeptide (TPR) repeat protein